MIATDGDVEFLRETTTFITSVVSVTVTYV